MRKRISVFNEPNATDFSSNFHAMTPKFQRSYQVKSLNFDTSNFDEFAQESNDKCITQPDSHGGAIKIQYQDYRPVKKYH